MPTLPRKIRFFLPTFVVTLLIDQLTKIWIVERFSYGELLPVIPGFFNLTHVRNPGGAFSFLATMPGEICATPSFWGPACSGDRAADRLPAEARKPPMSGSRRWRSAACSGGAIGNLTDRVVYGEVIDFLDFRLIGGYVWPTFNMADCWIVGGVGILMLEMFLEPDGEEGIGGDDQEPAGDPPIRCVTCPARPRRRDPAESGSRCAPGALRRWGAPVVVNAAQWGAVPAGGSVAGEHADHVLAQHPSGSRSRGAPASISAWVIAATCRVSKPTVTPPS